MPAAFADQEQFVAVPRDESAEVGKLRDVSVSTRESGNGLDDHGLVSPRRKPEGNTDTVAATVIVPHFCVNSGSPDYRFVIDLQM